MHLRSLIKLNAKRALRKNWSRAMAIALLLTGVSLLFMLFEALLMAVFDLPSVVDQLETPSFFLDDLPNISSSAMLIMFSIAGLCFLVTAPLRQGARGWFFKVGRGEAGEISDVFEFFSTWSKLLKSGWLYLNVALRTSFWVTLFVLPAASVVVFSSLFSRQALSQTDELIATGGMTAGVILGLSCFVLALIWCSKYSCAAYLIIQAPEMSVQKAIKQSARLTKGHRGELFKMQVSLLGWRMFGMFIVTRLFTIPFIETVEGLYASYLIQLAEQEPQSFEPKNVAENPSHAAHTKHVGTSSTSVVDSAIDEAQ